MPDYTSYLNLTLPELNEFVDSWNEPVNQNMEDLDDWTKDLYDNLVGTGSGSVWAALRGSKTSLSARLDVSINADGTIDVSSSADVLNMAISAVDGQISEPSGTSSPRARLDGKEMEIFGARQPAAGGRFVPISPAGPATSFPPEGLDSGIAIRSADYGVNANEPISSPQVPWAPGLVTGGSSPFLTAVAEGQVQLNASTTPAIFNIDGYVFSIRDDILFDYSGTSPVHDEYQWFYVERIETGYGNPNFKYGKPGGIPAPVAKDLRRLKSGSAGAVGGTPTLNEFTDASALLDTEPFPVKEGDLLVVEGSVAASGVYVIDALDGSTPDTKLTIKGQFYGAGSGLTWHILNNSMPNIGVAVATANRDLPTSRPPVVAGRVYFARALHQSPGVPSPLVNFTKGGVYDSGWFSVDATAFTIGVHGEHALGAIPSSVELWVRVDDTTPAYRPTVRRQLVTKMAATNFPNPVAGDTSSSYFRVPSMFYRCTETEINIYLENESADPAAGPSLFTDSANVEVTAGDLRIIARR